MSNGYYVVKQKNIHKVNILFKKFILLYNLFYSKLNYYVFFTYYLTFFVNIYFEYYFIILFKLI